MSFNNCSHSTYSPELQRFEKLNLNFIAIYQIKTKCVLDGMWQFYIIIIYKYLDVIKIRVEKLYPLWSPINRKSSV